ncbi:MAG: hypothetical protein Q4G25_14285 [Paracoccus sp. (in: a-proteobacteria)]|nr:hypothetical protein [Paracoccus sp. (in: a-proteobacteria)]
MRWSGRVAVAVLLAAVAFGLVMTGGVSEMTQIAIAIAVPAAAVGFRQARNGRVIHGVAMPMVCLMAGLLCYYIGENATGGGYLDGIVGIVSAVVLWIMTGALVLGGGLGALNMRPADERHPGPPVGAWLVYAAAVVLMVLSLLE